MVKNKVTHELRQGLSSVGKLLVALDDKDKVSIIADEEMLDLFIFALRCVYTWGKDEQIEKAEVLIEDLKQLRKEAFGK